MNIREKTRLISSICHEIKDYEERLSRVREELALAPPLQTIALCYKKQHPIDEPLKSSFLSTLALIRNKYPTRRKFLKWVYEDDRLIDHLAFLQMPSMSKRVLVRKLVEKSASRYPWMTSRLIHTMAFRPEFFEKTEIVRNSWGPLYRRKQLSKGIGKTRILEIPNPPLRRLQRILLNEVFNPAMDELPSCVIGCRGGKESTIFQNAARHIGQSFVVTFDLKDFFHSVSIRHVIPSLKTIKGDMLREISSSEDEESVHSEAVGYPWTADAAVLVGRLVTCRGHLPQGAPTSPAVANLAFRRYDKKIMESLGEGFVYTRYVDDITVSISKAAARKIRIADEVALRRYATQKIETALTGSGFRLNEKKTRVGRFDIGHRITGLRVVKSNVEIPRSFKRTLRSLIYRIRKQGIVDAACDLVGADILARTQLIDGLRHVYRGRRLSTECLAVLMLRRLCPDLSLEMPSVSSFTKINEESQCEEIRGKEAWRVVERLLPHIWKYDVACEMNSENLLVLDKDGQNVCRLTANTNLHFFLLPKRQAISCVEFWHKLKGLESYLSVKEPDPCFEPIRRWREELSKVIRELKIPPVKTDISLTPSQGILAISLTEEQDILRISRESYGLIHEFRSQLISEPLSRDHVKLADKFQLLVKSVSEFQKWLQAATYLCINELPFLPADGGLPGLGQTNIFELMRILFDRVNNKRSHEYKVETEWLKILKLSDNCTDIMSIEDKHAMKLQKNLLSSLKRKFNASLKLRQALGPDKWQKGLLPNEWYEALPKRLIKATDEFRKLHAGLTSEKSTRRLFRASANNSLAKNFPVLRDSIADTSSQRVWEKIFEFGRIVVEVTIESLDGERQHSESQNEFQNRILKDFQDRLGHFKKHYDMIYLLRCRASHAPDPSKIHEWRGLQNYAADLLGKRKPKFPREQDEMFGPDDLQLTALEGTEIKLYLIKQICAGLKHLLTVLDSRR